MLSTATALAILTTGGFVVVYSKLPRRMRKFIEKHSLATDVVALFLAYMLLGGTLTALTASAMVGLMISGLLHIQNNREDFEWLFDGIDFCKTGLASLGAKLKEMGQNYRRHKLEEANRC